MFHTNVAEEIKTQYIRPVTPSENLAVCEIMLKNVLDPDTPQMTI
jgi:hypothetical protein